MNRNEFKKDLGKVQTEVFKLRLAVGTNTVDGLEDADSVFDELSAVLLKLMELQERC